MRSINDFIVPDFFKNDMTEIETFYCPIDETSEMFNSTVIWNNRIEHFQSERVNLMTYWLEYYDLNRYTDEPTMYSKLQEFSNDIAVTPTILTLIKADNLEQNIKAINPSVLYDIFERSVNIYKEYVSFHPFFQMYCELVHKLLYNFHCLISDLGSFNVYYDNICQTEKIICEYINVAITLQSQCKSYILDTLLYPTNLKVYKRTGYVIANYESYLNYQDKESVYGNISRELLPPPLYGTNYAWTDILQLQPYTPLLKEKIKTDYDYSKQFVFGINYFIETDSILKTCPSCNRCFVTKYSSSTVYCHRFYKDTKGTCQEVSSRNKYKKKLNSHPIHAEYLKAYNRMYARVRRGNISEGEAKLDVLKVLRDSYYEKYEKTLNIKTRNSILNTFIEKINSLYI